MTDPEIEAISAIATALADLEDETRKRVLRWAADRYGMPVERQGPRRGTGAVGTKGDGAEVEHPSGNGGAAAEAPEFEHFAELFDAADPKTNEDKALVAGYWLQVMQGHDKGWQSAALQKELKHLGHAIPNITDALTSNMEKKPQRVIQLQKAGSSRQARKTYKVTHAGISNVEATLRHDA
jgi:hypothetical protein